MADWKLKLYSWSPLIIRSVIASVHGYYLRTLRYGRETESMVLEFLEHETWSVEQWKAWQEERLAFVLHRAATQVPYYRDHWSKRRRCGDRASWEVLDNWPILNKDDVRINPYLFVADDCDIHTMYHEHTSGTTGKSLDLWWSRKTVKNWYALVEARCRRWHNISRYDRWAILGGQLVTPVGQRYPPFWVWNAGLDQLYMSSYHLAPDLIPAYLDALKQYQVCYLWGYTSSIYMLAVEAIRLRRTDVKMKVVITNAEPLYDYQRNAISAAFDCSVRETYGMAEIVSSASECEQGRLHIWPEAGIIETMRKNSPIVNGTSGDFICTGLFNADMPLIRYAIGDLGSLESEDEYCKCGRTLPRLRNIMGRVDDIVCTRDGRQVGRLDLIFKTHLPVIEAQIIQESLDEIRVRFVPAPDYQEHDGKSIIDRLQARLGTVSVILEPVSVLPRESNGKFRAVISKIQQSYKPQPEIIL